MIMKLPLMHYMKCGKKGKEGTIIPIPKPNKSPTKCESHRPITLTNCPSKVFEKIINRRLQYFLESNNFYDRNQSGFRASHSTLDGLIRYHHGANTALREGKYCLAVFLDIMQAFDTVWHHGLIKFLKETGMTGNLPRRIQEFLSSRKISQRQVPTTQRSPSRVSTKPNSFHYHDQLHLPQHRQ